MGGVNVEFNIEKDKIMVGTIIFLLVVLVGGYGYMQSKPEDKLSLIDDRNGKEEEPEQHVEEYIYVHVSGNVQNTGVYKLPQGSRVLHIIEMAGGSTEEGDIDKLNLAQVLQDGQKVVVPSIHDEVAEATDQWQGQTSGLTNLNTATQQQLEALAGIGPAKASAIITYRDQNGPFKEIEDIQKVSGIGAATFTQIKDSITVR